MKIDTISQWSITFKRLSYVLKPSIPIKLTVSFIDSLFSILQNTSTNLKTSHIYNSNQFDKQ